MTAATAIKLPATHHPLVSVRYTFQQGQVATAELVLSGAQRKKGMGWVEAWLYEQPVVVPLSRGEVVKPDGGTQPQPTAERPCLAGLCDRIYCDHMPDGSKR